MYPCEYSVVIKIQEFFEEQPNQAWFYVNNAGNEVTCQKVADGVNVTCLGNYPFLPWGVFWHAVHIMLIQGGRAARGSAQGGQLGTQKLPFNSVEGYVASVIYGKASGDWVFQRISPIAHILIGAGVCHPLPGDLKLLEI